MDAVMRGDFTHDGLEAVINEVIEACARKAAPLPEYASREAANIAAEIRALASSPGAPPTPATPTGMQPGQRCTRHVHGDRHHDWTPARNGTWSRKDQSDRCTYIEPASPTETAQPGATQPTPVTATCATCGGSRSVKSRDPRWQTEQCPACAPQRGQP